MLTRDELKSNFASESERPLYLDFKPRITIVGSKPIESREAATRKSLQLDNIDDIAGLEGSPSFEVVNSLVKVLKDARILPKLTGIGVEVGSGLGLLSAALIRQDNFGGITGILAVEAGLPFVETGIKLAAQSTLGNQAIKIMPCYGSFDQLAIESNAVDFIVQIEALHHADDLGPPLTEAHRILKPGGFFVSIDRSWPNNVSTIVLEELLDHRYSSEWLEVKGFPSDKPFSRRDNGEHEYRDLEWENAFKNAGFTSKRISHLHPPFKLWHFKKRSVGILKLNRLARIKIPSRSGLFRGFILEKINLKFLRIGGLVGTKHPRPLTVSVWQKI